MNLNHKDVIKKMNNNEVTFENKRNAIESLPTTNINAKKQNGISYVILDSNAIIERKSFYNSFNANVKYFMTVSSYNEVQDKASRLFLDSFPYKIYKKEPNTESVRFVSKWLSKNSYLKSLSKQDRQIIALVHTIEKEINGNININKIPVSSAKKEQIKLMKKLNEISQSFETNNNNNSNNKSKKKSNKSNNNNQVLKDTNVRMAEMRNVVHFDFYDFMTLNKDECMFFV